MSWSVDAILSSSIRLSLLSRLNSMLGKLRVLRGVPVARCEGECKVSPTNYADVLKLNETV